MSPEPFHVFRKDLNVSSAPSTSPAKAIISSLLHPEKSNFDNPSRDSCKASVIGGMFLNLSNKFVQPLSAS